jgi:hypothetical protein
MAAAQREQTVSENNPIRVFVTHVFKESNDYLRVFEFLESVDRFYYINVSKPENIPTEGGVEGLKDELIQQIKAAEVLVVIASIYDTEEEMVGYMMDVAAANCIKMVAIRPFGGMVETAPSIVERVSEHLEWNAREMADAISRQGRGEDTARWEVIDFPGFDVDGAVK